VRAFLRENGLAVGFGIAFLATLVAQSYAGYLENNNELAAHHEELISYFRFLVSSEFGAAVMENWQSEFLQFTLYIVATVWLLQRGSNESKPLDQGGRESDQAQKIGPYATSRSPKWARVGGVRTWVYSNSLGLLMGFLFFGSWLSESLSAWTQYNSDQTAHMESTVSWGSYLGTSNFWERSLENWQSELLAVGCMAVFSIYLRQRGSPESKPVGAPHEQTSSGE
jgi:hypothetical protein